MTNSKPLSLRICNVLKYSAVCIVLFFTHLMVNAQEADAKQEAQIQRLKMALEKSQVAHHRQVGSMQLADSLFTVGQQMYLENSISLKAINDSVKQRAKEYKSERKIIEKGLKAKSREEVAAAKTQLKDFDAAYKTQLRADETKVKSYMKSTADAVKTRDKGKKMKKSVAKNLNNTKKALELAQINFDEASNVSDEPKEKKSKKNRPTK